MSFFNTWIFSQFPKRFKKDDTYKDANGRGVLERYLQIFGQELDNNFMPLIQNMQDILSVKKCDDKFLPLIGAYMGALPAPDNLPATYRLILAAGVQIYKAKGTANSFKIMFNILGYDCNIVPIQPIAPATYDSTQTYDDGTSKYDQSCSNCTDFSIRIQPSDPSLVSGFVLTTAIRAQAQQIVDLLKPIDCNYTGLYSPL